MFSFLFQRPSAEERVAAYVIREHERGRDLVDILQDRYVQNRLTPQQVARLLDRPEVIRALGQETRRSARGDRGLDSGPKPRSRARSTAAAPIAISQAAIPFDLKTTMSRVGLPSGELARDDLLQLVHLEPVEHAAPRPARSGRPTRASRPRASRSTRTTRARARRCRARAPASVRADRAHERALAQPLAAKHRIARVVTVTTMSCSAASRWLSPGSARRSQNAREPLRGAAVGDDALDRRDRRPDRGDLRSACQPQPITPRLRAPAREVLAATPLAAPVRSWPSRSASITASSVPVCEIEEQTTKAAVAGDAAYAFTPAYPSSRRRRT